MKRKINKSVIIIALCTFIVGMGMVILFGSDIAIGIGCSLVASAVMLVFTASFVDASKVYSVWDEWKLEKIFKTRAEKNNDSDPKLEKHNVKQLDGIAFGLKSFRSNREEDLLMCMHNGLNVRLLVMNPNGKFIAQREQEENAKIGSMTKSIEDLKKWADDLNSRSAGGKIEIKYYNIMTLDFYWRMDDEVYIGPYMYGIESQQTITYKYKKGGRGFDLYTKYFEKLWNDADISQIP